MSKNRLINRWKNINLTYTSKTEISCYVCDFNINIPSCKIYKDSDIFEAGELIRYQCQNCDVIFGDLSFLNMKIRFLFFVFLLQKLLISSIKMQNTSLS